MKTTPIKRVALIFDNSAAMGNVTIDAISLDRALAGRSSIRRFEADGDPIRARTSPVVRDGQIVGVLEVGQSEDDISETLATLLLILGIAYPVTLGVAVLGGIFLAGRALSPVDKITTQARLMSADHLGQRMDLQLPDDELGRLARTFDDMIARLDHTFQRQRQFTADASHELRTPLTIMKGQIDVALQHQREPEEYRQVLAVVNDEVDRLIRLAGSLLTLTRADAGEIPLELEEVDLPAVIADVVEQLRPSAEHMGVDLKIVPGGPVTISADGDLLLQLLLNVLDNAIKYTPDGGEVSVGWNVAIGHVELSVSDTGIGIAAEHIPLIFDRFYRVDKARSRAEGGAGLGLAISRWIVEAHGGSIRAESTREKGSLFTVSLPNKLNKP